MSKKNFIFVCSTLLLLFALFFSYAVTCFAYIECDGRLNGYEWENEEKNVLFSSFGHSGCSYHSACAQIKFIEEDRRVYLAVSLENLPDKFYENPDLVENKITFSFNDSSEIILSSNGTGEYNTDEFFVNYAYLPDGLGGGSYEAEIVLKETDYTDTLEMFIKVTDPEGGSSQIYNLIIKSEELKVEESESAAKSEKEKTTKSPKTTKSKTTKTKTTKIKTTAETTEFVTAIITENYESFSETQNKRMHSILAVGISGVVLAFGAMCVMIFKKEKK